MVVGVTLNTSEGSLQFTENGVALDEPIYDHRFKSVQLFPAVSVMFEGDQVLFTESLEWKGVDYELSKQI